MRPPTADEARRVLAAAAEHALHALFELAIRVGLRRGEMLGLRWADLDEAAGLLTVRQSVQHRRDTGAIIVLPPRPPRRTGASRSLTKPSRR